MGSARHVVIVGAGVAGVATVVQLARRDRAGIGAVTLVDVNPPGHGLAFGCRDAAALCNTSAAIGSLVADQPDDFVVWLRARGRQADGSAFVPRSLVAQYAQERYRTARLALCDGGARLRQVHALARGVTGTPGHYVVHTDAGPVPATDVVVCAGATTPVVPEPLAPHVGAVSVTIGPYPLDRLVARTGPATRVLMIGTRLSAVDAALVLAGEGRHVTLTSRSGLLPAVRTRFQQPAFPLPTRARLAALDPGDPLLATHLMRIAVEHLRAQGALPLRHHLSTTREAMTRLREEARLAAAGRSSWQELGFDLATGLNDAAWTSAVDARTRAELTRRFAAYLTRYLTAMPLINAQKLLDHHDRGRLTVAPAFPTRIAPARRGWRVEGIARESQFFDHLVSAAGYTAPYLSVNGQASGPLTLTLRTSPPAVASPHTVDGRQQLRRRAGAAGERIWLVGLTVGKHVFAPNFLPTVVSMAARATAFLTVTARRAPRPAVGHATSRH